MYSLLSPTGQDLLMPCAELFGATSTACGGPGGSGDPVPAPATLVLFGAGLMALAGMRRRKA
ncbi:MAG: PEP-CTERM sorting domain-containing protein [Alphaproteobacteria bacterium]|nr:PEP-CTERM sorting domain-containing protein [Alphaproteobacteria bacterium]